MARGSGDISYMKNVSTLGSKLINVSHSVFQRWQSLVHEQILQPKGIHFTVSYNLFLAFITNLEEELSPDFPRKTATSLSMMAQESGGRRARIANYGVEIIVQEHQLLRRVIFDVFEELEVVLHSQDIATLNFIIDGWIKDAVVGYSAVHDELEKKFIATLTHDLRNPLGAAFMAAQMIQLDLTSGEVQDMANCIVSNLKRADLMIQDLLDTTLVKFGERLLGEIAQHDMRELMLDSIASATTMHGNRFEFEGNVCLGFWSKNDLQRAFDNLITNAIKYGHEHSPVTIKLTTELGRVFVSVRNEGNPIAPEHQKTIFEAYQRTDEAKKGSNKGWGLGLTSVQEVAENHGGTIEVDSELERGTTFTIDLPIDSRLVVKRRIT